MVKFQTPQIAFHVSDGAAEQTAAYSAREFGKGGGANFDSSGYLQTAIKLTAEHELLRNVLLSAYVAYVNSDFQGISRTDDQYETNVEGRYLLNRNLSLNADLTYTKRDSNVIGVSYDRVVGMLALKAGF